MYYIIIFFIFISISIKAKGHETKGIIIYNNGDTINVLFDIPVFGSMPDLAKMQKKVWYYKKGVFNRILLKPEEAKEIIFIYNHYLFRMIQCKVYKRCFFKP